MTTTAATDDDYDRLRLLVSTADAWIQVNTVLGSEVVDAAVVERLLAELDRERLKRRRLEETLLDLAE